MADQSISKSFPEKEKPDLLAVMQMAGVDISRVANGSHGMLRCAFHEDKGKPNMSVWPATGRWKCFRCGIGGDVYDFVGFQLFGDNWNKLDKQMFIEVVSKLKDSKIPVVKVTPTPPRPQAEVTAIYNVLTLASRVYAASLESSVGQQAREYLSTRKIDMDAARKMRLGYCHPGLLATALSSYPKPLQDAAETAGLFHDGREWLQNRIIFSDVGSNGSVKHMVGRSLEPEAYIRYLSLPGIDKTIYRLGMASKSQPILLTESMVDTVNLCQMGFQGAGVNGTGLAQYLVPLLSAFPFIAIVPQNDDASRESVVRWLKEIPHARVLEIPYREAEGEVKKEKDINDLVTKYGVEATRQMLVGELDKVGIRYK